MDLNSYYTSQAGDGIAGFAGIRYQKGNGFFGRILKGTLPFLKYLGRKALGTGVNVAEDVLNNNETIRDSFKKQIKATTRKIAEDGVSKAKAKLGQDGNGKKTRRKKKKNAKTISETKQVSGKKSKKNVLSEPATKKRKKKKKKSVKNLYDFC